MTNSVPAAQKPLSTPVTDLDIRRSSGSAVATWKLGSTAVWRPRRLWLRRPRGIRHDIPTRPLKDTQSGRDSRHAGDRAADTNPCRLLRRSGDRSLCPDSLPSVLRQTPASTQPRCPRQRRQPSPSVNPPFTVTALEPLDRRVQHALDHWWSRANIVRVGSRFPAISVRCQRS